MYAVYVDDDADVIKFKQASRAEEILRCKTKLWLTFAWSSGSIQIEVCGLALPPACLLGPLHAWGFWSYRGASTCGNPAAGAECTFVWIEQIDRHDLKFLLLKSLLCACVIFQQNSKKQSFWEMSWLKRKVEPKLATTLFGQLSKRGGLVQALHQNHHGRSQHNVHQ